MEYDLLILGKLLVAALLGVLIGLERDLKGKAAGIRTNCMIAVGSCLFTILSIEMGTLYDADPSRIASGVVSGVGFLGAGTVLKENGTVKGLTTAAEIWLTAAIGMTIGLGHYILGICITILAVTVLIVLSPASHKVSDYAEQKTIREANKKRQKLYPHVKEE